MSDVAMSSSSRGITGGPKLFRFSRFRVLQCLSDYVKILCFRRFAALNKMALC